MKTKQFKYNFFIILILSVLMVSFNSCNKDDENDDIATFLDSYTGTIWFAENENDEKQVYIRFLLDEMKIFEVWSSYLLDDCYYYTNHLIWEFNLVNAANTSTGKILNKNPTPPSPDILIIENFGDKLIYKLVFDETRFSTFTFIIEGEILKVIYVYERVGFEPVEKIHYFNKTMINLDELPLCN